ncbi:hypothetical protein INT47_002168 [Mucor saturninus]|uniref:Uncharacterized protein n=1 Tax=Mucor saturninus TaxID=64648 RepID=A0A8H7UVQ1_9FUNG|nr:hypothetical protein INT47_002168 [Mucor saturninus]
MRQRETKQTFVNEGVKTLAKAASTASKLVQEALELDANTPSNEQRKEEGDQEQGDNQENGDKEKELQERDEVEEVCEETTEMNNEQRLHVLAYKKFAGDKITDIDCCIADVLNHRNNRNPILDLSRQTGDRNDGNIAMNE